MVLYANEKEKYLQMKPEVISLKGRKASIFTKLVVLGIIVYTSVTLAGLHGQMENAREMQASLEQAVAEIIEENAALEYEIENSDNPEVIERIARNRYNLVMPGERVFYGVIN